MKLSKRVLSLLATVLLSVTSLFSLGVPRVFAVPFTCVWTGASDTHFNTAGNWSSCNSTFPQNGDTISFDMTVPTTDLQVIDNNIANLDVAGINVTGAGSSNKSFKITGNGFTLSGPISETQSSGLLAIATDVTLGADLVYSNSANSVTFGFNGSSTILDLGSHSLTYNIPTYDSCPLTGLYSALKGSGNLNLIAGHLYLLTPENTYTGSAVVSSGELGLGTGSLGASNSVTVNGDSILSLVASSDSTFSMPITMNSTGNPALNASPSMINVCGGAAPPKTTTTISGAFTLSRDTIFEGSNDVNVTGTYTPNGHTLSTKLGSPGSITTSAGTVETAAQTVTIEATDKDPNADVFAGNKEILILDGERRGVTVSDGGTLKGTGKANSLFVQDGGTVAPGHSPGTITVVNTLNLNPGSTYQLELKNTNAYDQIVVNSGGSVTITDAILYGLITEGFSMKAGDTFRIIDNQTSNPVSGTFNNLAEGATFKISDGVFKISYVGGDGNDVVLTVVTVPTVANTGAHLLTSSLALIVAGTMALTLGAYGFGRRLRGTKIIR